MRRQRVPTFTARCGSALLLVGAVARMRAPWALSRRPAGLLNLRLCIILPSDARWPSFAGQRPSSGVGIVARQDIQPSFLFIGENNHSTMIIDKVAISTLSVPATSSSDAVQYPAANPCLGLG